MAVTEAPTREAAGGGILATDGGRQAVPSTARSAAIDFLRGLAILLVIGHHMTVHLEDAGPLRLFYLVWGRLGWTGVDLFFVLSGFLIGGLLFREIALRGSLDLRRFVVRRGLRIWPLYYLYLSLVTALAVKHQHSFRKGLAAVWTNWLHLQNYPVLGHTSPLYHTWSLSLEEHFYLALPLALLPMIARQKRVAGALTALPFLPALAAIVMVTCPVLRFLHPEPYRWEYKVMTHLRIDSLVFGVLLAYLAQFHRPIFMALGRRRWILLVVGLTALLPFAVIAEDARYTWTLGFTQLYLAYSCLLVALVSAHGTEGVGARLLRGRFGRTVAFVGFYSYPIYLFHIGLGRGPEEFVLRHLHGGPAVLHTVIGAAVFGVCSISAGVILGRLVERPTLALRDRLYPSREKEPLPHFAAL